MLDVLDALRLIETDKQINIVNYIDGVYHLLWSGFKEDLDESVTIFDDIETYEVENIVIDASGVNLVVYVEEDYFTVPDDMNSFIDFYEITSGRADREMQQVYNWLGFKMI